MEIEKQNGILKDLIKGVFSVSGYRAIEKISFKAPEISGAYISKYLAGKTKDTLIAVYLKNFRYKGCMVLTQGKQREAVLFIDEIKTNACKLKADGVIIAHNYYEPSQFLETDILKASNIYIKLSECKLKLIDYLVCKNGVYRSVMEPYKTTAYNLKQPESAVVMQK